MGATLVSDPDVKQHYDLVIKVPLGQVLQFSR